MGVPMNVFEHGARPGQTSLGFRPIVIGSLALIIVLLAVIAFNSHRLVIEQQRTTCFARLAWISPGVEELPAGVERSSSARLCEGNSPLIEYQDEGD